jgi:molecular chaperone GrpE
MKDEKEPTTTVENGIDPGPAKNEAGVEAMPGVAQQVVSAPLPTADVAELTASIRKFRAEKEELYDRLLRKQAELENLRKQMEREKEEFCQNANAELIRDLLPSLDSIERALEHRDARVPEQFYNGVEMIDKGLFDVMKPHGLEPIETVGRTFDPHLHQAVGTVEDDRHRDREIVEELLRGYKLKQRLLRPSMVKVAVTPKRHNSLSEGTKSSKSH